MRRLCNYGTPVNISGMTPWNGRLIIAATAQNLGGPCLGANPLRIGGSAPNYARCWQPAMPLFLFSLTLLGLIYFFSFFFGDLRVPCCALTFLRLLVPCCTLVFILFSLGYCAEHNQFPVLHFNLFSAYVSLALRLT